MRSTTILSFVILAGLLFSTADGHGSMMKPYGWSDAGGTWFPGMENPCHHVGGATWLTEVVSNPERFIEFMNNGPNGIGKSCDWYSNYTHIPGDRTIDPSARYELSHWSRKVDPVTDWLREIC